MLTRLRIPLLVAWVIILGVVGYLATHPRLIAPWASHLASRNLLRGLNGQLRVRDFRLHYLQGVDLYGVSLTLPGERGGVTLVSADTVQIGYRLGEVLRSPFRLRWLRLNKGEIYSLAGEPGDEPRGPPRLHWPHLQVDQIEIQNFFLEYSGADGRLRQRLSELNWRGSLRADRSLVLDCRDADIAWETRGARISRVYGEVAVSDAGLRATGLHGRVNATQLLLDGQRTWDGAFDLSVRAENAVAAEVEELLDLKLGFAARLDLEAAFRSRGDSLSIDGVFDGELEGYRLQRVVGRGLVTPGSLHWRELQGGVNGTRFDGRGDFDLSDPASVRFVLEGDVADVNLAAGLVPGEELPATDGHGHLVITHQDVPLWTHVTGYLLDGRLDRVPFDSCAVDVEADAAGVTFHEIELERPGLRARLTGDADTSRVFGGDLVLDASDLSLLPPEWGWPALAGQLDARGEVNGRQEDLSFTGDVQLQDARISPLTLQAGRADVLVEDALGRPRVTAFLQGDGLVLGGVDLGRCRVLGWASPEGARVDSFRSQLGDTMVTFRGDAAFSDTTSVYRLRDLAIDLEGASWRLEQPVTFVTRGPLYALPQFRLASQYGELTATNLQRRPGGQLDGTLRLQSFDLGLLNPFLPPGGTRLNGLATATLQLSGTAGSPEAGLEAAITGCDLQQARIDSLHVLADYRADELAVARLDLHSNQGRLLAHGTMRHPGAGLRDFWPDAELDLALTVEDGDWAVLDPLQLQALDRLAGRFRAQLNVTGTTRLPEITGEVTSEPFNVHWLHLERMAARLHVDSEQFVLSDLEGRQGDLNATGRIEVPLKFDLLSTPLTPEQDPFLMRFQIPPDSDLEPLARATNAFVEVRGRGEGEVTIAGPLSHPLWQGHIKMQDAGFVLRGQQEIYHDVNATGRFAGDVLTLDSIAGREGQRGTIRGTGTVTFAGLELETFDIDMDVDRFLVASIPDLRALIRSPAVHLQGVKVGPDSLIVPRFTGYLEVIQARYTGDFSEKPGSTDARLATVAPDWLADLHLLAPPRSGRILNRAMELDLSGDVDLVRDEEGLSLRGSMNIDAGRMPVFNNDFRVVRGQLDFSQAGGLDPGVDIAAETTVRVQDPTLSSSSLERITVLITGTLYSPVINFTSESGYGREGIERMLLGLSPYAGAPWQSTGLQGASIAAGFNLLEREIATGLNMVDTFDIQQIERTTTEGTQRSALIGVGKYVGQALYIKYAQGLSEADRDLLVEYQMTDHMLLQSEIRQRVDELQGETTYSLDLKYRFEY